MKPERPRFAPAVAGTGTWPDVSGLVLDRAATPCICCKARILRYGALPHKAPKCRKQRRVQVAWDRSCHKLVATGAAALLLLSIRRVTYMQQFVACRDGVVLRPCRGWRCVSRSVRCVPRAKLSKHDDEALTELEAEDRWRPLSVRGHLAPTLPAYSCVDNNLIGCIFFLAASRRTFSI